MSGQVCPHAPELLQMFSSRMSSILRSTPDGFREERILHVRLGRGDDFASDDHLAFAQFRGGDGCVHAIRSPELDLDWPDEFAVLHPEAAVRGLRGFLPAA